MIKQNSFHTGSVMVDRHLAQKSVDGIGAWAADQTGVGVAPNHDPGSSEQSIK
ncbi:MAG: hypothetical protein PHI94_03150 [Eubacteriaceae bacterium]|nr:hypothetical protein [Eubacteriaceae bacterium]MDD4508040.1 hypothetical protein [Eubacteriaceae bacterium]